MSKLAREMAVIAAAGKARISGPVHPGIVALRSILKALRWDDQGGYPGYRGDGKWGFVSTALPQTTPKQLNALFDLAGLVPNVIESKGSCEDCVHAAPVRRGESGFLTYHERGYSGLCSPCKRPQMSNFEARKVFPKARRFWCFQCGNLFKKREDRDLHVEQRVKCKCPLTGEPG